MLMLLIISLLVLIYYSLYYTSHYPVFTFGSVVSNEVPSDATLLISKQYVLAMGFALLERLTEIFSFPEVKEFWFVINIGLLMVIIGENP
jgi:hypothetical protein